MTESPQAPQFSSPVQTAPAATTPPFNPVENVPVVERKSSKTPLIVGMVVVVLALIAGGIFVLTQNKPKESPLDIKVEEDESINLTYATHWLEDYQINGVVENGVLESKGLKQYLDEYTVENPNVTFQILQVPYGEYAGKLQLLHDTDSAPDIYSIYSTWGVQYQSKGVLDTPPDDVKAAVNKDFLSTAGVTIDGDIWGIPTEINDYMLIYNKDVFKDAGIVDSKGEAKVPVTWAELVADAKKIAEKDAQGNLTRYGISFTANNNDFVVAPFLSVLLSNGGEFLSEDYSSCLLDNEKGVETLKAMQELFDSGATDMQGSVYDIASGKSGMAILAPWNEGNLRNTLKDKFETTIGVAPIPYMKKPATLQYSWFMGVMNKSKNKEAAWDFLRWFALEPQTTTGTTRYGDLMAQTIGAIPSREADQTGNASFLNTPFRSKFITELENSVPEPNILESSQISTIIMNELQSSWSKTKTPEQALKSACEAIEPIIDQYYKAD